ncbi:DUF4229 domain-containing protein [Nocardioides insulae]|uniref:DUF4229 domain-containing protein n=1 Tax=Nocardioides insulae TaxID=394734 RepID=UPI0003F7B104|nr:DUF4229 domain-containing protein [Nocardioides insulae]
MKQFLVYSGLRLLFFVVAYALVAGIWLVVTQDAAPFFWTLVIALILSGIASFVLLERQRVEFATRVEKRASNAIEKMRSREDED